MDRIRKQFDRDTEHRDNNYSRWLPAERRNRYSEDVENELRYRSDRNNDDRDQRYYERNNNRRRDRDESYVSTLRNYHPRGGRRIEPSREEDNFWQGNPGTGRSDYNYEREARNYNREDDYRWQGRDEDYSRYRRNDRGFRDDYDTDFYWQT